MQISRKSRPYIALDVERKKPTLPTPYLNNVDGIRMIGKMEGEIHLCLCFLLALAFILHPLQFTRDLKGVRMPSVIRSIALPAPEDVLGAGDEAAPDLPLISGGRIALDADADGRIRCSSGTTEGKMIRIS